MDFLVSEDVSKHFAGHTALDHVSLRVPKNSVFGLLGPNGAGKTTLIRIINRIIAPDNGTIYFNGDPLDQKHIARIGYLPEERGLYKKMKVGEQALYLAQLKGLPAKTAMDRLKYWFKKFEIEGWWNKKVEELSKGMQQKVQFITTVLHKPELLIFDEPFSGFDPINVNLLKAEILQLKEEGATILFSTHNMASVEELCDHIVLINRSKKILEGNVKEIKQQHKSNIYEIEYSDAESNLGNILSNGFEILSEEQSDTTSTARIQLPPGAGKNELLHHLIQEVTIHSYREIIPSMNEIFIQKVKEDPLATAD